jgi:ABC-type nitrate/sulfonate/bicarbonate transport system substrate-binding protein
VRARIAGLAIVGLTIISFPAQKLEAQLKTIRIAYPSVDVQYLPAHVSKTQGVFKAEGLDVELIVIRGARSGIQALMSGDVQFVLPIGPVVSAVWGGAELKILAQMVGMPTFSLIVRPEIQQVRDLAGKRIGVSIGGAPFAFVHELLKANGMDPEKGVQYVNIPGAMPKLAALENGLIVAAPLAPPGDFNAIRAGFKRLVFFGDVMPDISFTGLATTSRYVKEHPQTVDRVVRAIARGTSLVRDNPDLAIGAMQDYLKMTPNEARDTYRLLRRAFSPILTDEGLKNLATIVSSSSGVKATKDPKDYVERSFLNRALSDMGKR